MAKGNSETTPLSYCLIPVWFMKCTLTQHISSLRIESWQAGKKHIKHHAVAVVTVHSGSPDVLYKCISGVHGDMAHKLFHLQEDVFTLLLCLWEQL